MVSGTKWSKNREMDLSLPRHHFPLQTVHCIPTALAYYVGLLVGTWKYDIHMVEAF
jgi:hypothetical protein